MLSALLSKHAGEGPTFPLLNLPEELVRRIVACLEPEEQKEKKAIRATCTQLRAAVNASVTTVKIDSSVEGQTLPATVLPQLKSITLDVSNGQHMGLWSTRSLEQLGISKADPDCRIAVKAAAAILDIQQLHANLVDAGLIHRVCELKQECWGFSRGPAHFGKDIKVSAELKLVRMECVETLIRNTLEHDNLYSLSFFHLMEEYWDLSLMQAIMRCASRTLKELIIGFWPFLEFNLLPLAEANLPELEYLELEVQNTHGFGPQQLQPLSTANLPKLRHLVIKMYGIKEIAHLGEFLKPLVKFTRLETIDIWADRIESFAGLWGVGLGGIFLPELRRLKLGVAYPSPTKPRLNFAANPPDRVVDAFAGLSLDQLELRNIGLPPGAKAPGIKQLVLTDPRWEDLRIAMSDDFSPDLKVIRVRGASASTVRAQMLENMLETPSLEPSWRIGSPSSGSPMQKVRSFVVLHDLERAKKI